MKIRYLNGHGQGSCDRCLKKTGWSVEWTCMLIRIEGLEGAYCRKCAGEIADELGEHIELVEV